MITLHIKSVTDTSAAGQPLVTAKGQPYRLIETNLGRIGCFLPELFNFVEANIGRDIQGEIQTKGKYVSLVAVGGGGDERPKATNPPLIHHPQAPLPHPTNPPQEKDWEKINQRVDREVDISGSITNAVNLVVGTVCNTTKYTPEEAFGLVSPLAEKMLILKKSLRNNYSKII